MMLNMVVIKYLGSDKQMDKNQLHKKIAIIGGGIAGSSIAMYLAKYNVDIDVFEAGTSLVNGPPICHLHAGGNLYREISDAQCIALLKESIDTVQYFPHALNVRPTIIAVPRIDKGQPEELIPRLELLQQTYADLIDIDKANEVFGPASDYFKTYSKSDLQKISLLTATDTPKMLDEWLIGFSNVVDLEQLKYPVVLVQEYGLSVFRMAATAKLALSKKDNVKLNLSCKINGLKKEFVAKDAWLLSYVKDNQVRTQSYDYVINSAGFKTGMIDDFAEKPRERLVEFKAAYVTQWNNSKFGKWPEIIFHGERGTPQGMAQLTPYPNGFFQLHGMTEEITLFRDGLTKSGNVSAQPKLAKELSEKIDIGWDPEVQMERTQKAIAHLSQFLPDFMHAIPAGKPLYGAQQIPGGDITLRAANISYTQDGYFRAEIVKASSAIECAKEIACLLQLEQEKQELYHGTEKQILLEAEKLAQERGYPIELAQVY